ncbi:Na/Pi cotransporter family protein, partial [Candidatus Dependentiae bacterium]|nr:Na/Pi cotransporter family protein [Candidatus Dependentiae bacterium]
LMSDGLQSFAGKQLHKILNFLTNNRFMGLMVGTVITAIIQSSSATTVMVVGFCNAGLLNLIQAMGVILGANIGTTITAQIIAFKISQIALPIIGLGMPLYLFSKRNKVKFIGQILLGFGLLFLGLTIMKDGSVPLKESEQVIKLFGFFSLKSQMPFWGPLFGILVGAFFTVIFQSSSATIGLTLALASAGVIDIYIAVPLIFGENIGTTITALLASIGTNITAKRAALAHTTFNVLGVLLMFILFQVKVAGTPIYIFLVNKITPGDILLGENIERHIANSHTLFNVFNSLLFLPFLGLIAMITRKLIPGDEDELEFKLKFIDERFADNPGLAIPQAEKEVGRMLEIANETLELSVAAFNNKSTKKFEDIQKRERLLDHLQSDITYFLVKVSARESLTDNESEVLPVLMHTINDIERIGDHCINIIELIDIRLDKKIEFSQRAKDEIKSMYNLVLKMVLGTRTALKTIDKILAKENLVLENEINNLFIAFRISHMDRLNKGQCSPEAGFVFLDFMVNLEKIGDHLTNINQAILGEMQWSKGIKINKDL